jgi:hypothetical protein
MLALDVALLSPTSRLVPRHTAARPRSPPLLLLLLLLSFLHCSNVKNHPVQLNPLRSLSGDSRCTDLHVSSLSAVSAHGSASSSSLPLPGFPLRAQTTASARTNASPALIGTHLSPPFCMCGGAHSVSIAAHCQRPSAERVATRAFHIAIPTQRALASEGRIPG